MKLRTFLSIVGVISILFGVGFVIVPVEMLAQYGVAADRSIILMSRFFGTALIQIGLLFWLARSIIDSVGRAAIVLSGLISMVIGFLVALQGELSGVINALGWSTVVLYALFALGFAYFQFAPRRPAGM
ncbi:MAG TPA: hypothetical protein VIX87_01720 [Steroidobacteraceae bacterium]